MAKFLIRSCLVLAALVLVLALAGIAASWAPDRPASDLGA